MMSARHWRDYRVFWRTFIFWAWLASFVFGFAASDLFHAANCPEQLALCASTHNFARASVVQLPSALHALPLDADCLSCLLQLGTQGILVAALILTVSPFIALKHARLFRLRSGARAPISGARGPPGAFI